MIPYIFNSKDVYSQSLIHLINISFNHDIVGLEVGTYNAQNLCTLIQQCPNFKTFYGVDSFTPYTNLLINNYDGVTPHIVVDEKNMKYIELTAFHNIEYSGLSEKIIILKDSSENASKQIEDNSLDFIFLDAYSNKEDVIKDLSFWYPKLKTGGIFSGHDESISVVMEGVNFFRDKEFITSTMSCFDNVWVWKK